MKMYEHKVKNVFSNWLNISQRPISYNLNIIALEKKT